MKTIREILRIRTNTYIDGGPAHLSGVLPGCQPAMKTELVNLAKNVRRLRKSIHLSQEDLAFESGLNRTYICDIERAARNLSFGSLLKVARGLRTTVSELTHAVDTAVQASSHESGNSEATIETFK